MKVVTINRGKCMHPRSSVVHTGSYQIGPDGSIIRTGEPDNAKKCLLCQVYFYPGEIPLNHEDEDMS